MKYYSLFTYTCQYVHSNFQYHNGKILCFRDIPATNVIFIVFCSFILGFLIIAMKGAEGVLWCDAITSRLKQQMYYIVCEIISQTFPRCFCCWSVFCYFVFSFFEAGEGAQPCFPPCSYITAKIYNIKVVNHAFQANGDYPPSASRAFSECWLLFSAQW